MKVELRKWKEEDAPFLAEAANSEGVAENLRDGFPQPYKESDGRDFISFCHKNEGIIRSGTFYRRKFYVCS